MFAGISCDSHCSKISQFDCHPGIGSPSTLIIKICKPQFIQPDLTGFRHTIILAGIVCCLGISNSQHDGADIACVGISRYTYFVPFLIDDAEYRIITNGRTAYPHFVVPCLFYILKNCQQDLKTVLCRPYNEPVVAVIIVIESWRCNLQGDLVFVIIICIIGTYPKKGHKVIVIQYIILQRFSMYLHLEFTILAYIQESVFKNCPGISIVKSLYLQQE